MEMEHNFLSLSVNFHISFFKRPVQKEESSRQVMKEASTEPGHVGTTLFMQCNKNQV